MCGIPAVEMLGSEEDWMKLSSKLKVLRTLLEPIENDLGLRSKWWDLVQKVFWNLQTTYQGHPDEDWWSHIMSYQEAYESGMYCSINLYDCNAKTEKKKKTTEGVKSIKTT